MKDQFKDKRLLLLVRKPGIEAAVKTLRDVADEIEEVGVLGDNWLDDETEAMWIEEKYLTDLFDMIIKEREENL